MCVSVLLQKQEAVVTMKQWYLNRCM